MEATIERTTGTPVMPVDEQMSEDMPLAKTIEVMDDDSFSYAGYQVVRGEYFAHTYEPVVTFCDETIAVNTACIKRLPETEYIQILVNPDEKTLAVRPCAEDDKDSFRWTAGKNARHPKKLKCRVFYGKVVSLMGWDPSFRYKLVGKLIRKDGELLFVFDLTSAEIFVRMKQDGKTKTSRRPIYPEAWKDQFGVPIEEHRNILVDMFDGYTVFGLKDGKDNEKDGSREDGTEDAPKEETHEQ